MEIKDKNILLLGGWGLVGSAICRKLILKKPKRIIIASLLEEQAEEAVKDLIPFAEGIELQADWGNIFVRSEFKDMPRSEILKDPGNRLALIEDVLEPITVGEYGRFYLYDLITRTEPHIIIDCVNTATILAYQNIYATGLRLLGEMREVKDGRMSDGLQVEVETLLASLYVPQLVRHVQILQHAMEEVGTQSYMKVGTSGTGGMGLNIPYTHSEDKPSRMLLSKSSMAGAHSLLLFLLGRTPSAPYVKEVKPATAIAWKGIEHGEVRKGGNPIPLYDCPPDGAIKLDNEFDSAKPETVKALGKNLHGVFIDTGENGIFSLGEFTAITTYEQMEYITPEEIAETLIWEIEGGASGHDIVGALDASILGPTYRAGMMRNLALEKMRKFVADKQDESVAYELLGPPRLSKLLHEANLLKRVAKSINGVLATSAEDLSGRIAELITNDADLRSRIISIGIPILLPDGKSLLRGESVHVPHDPWKTTFEITPENIDKWAAGGWVDLRVKNMEKWHERLNELIHQAESVSENDTSSNSLRDKAFWNAEETLDEGEVVGWLFIHEDEGRRMK